MKRFKYIGLSLLVVLGAAFTSCERSYDDPKPEKIYLDSDFKEGQLVTIKDIKNIYYSVHPDDHISNKVEITEDLVIKGKVITNDKDGNFYRSMYIQDETGAIEIKVGISSLYNYFRPGQTVYVMCKSLVIGNYRFMLSLGFPATEKSDYANNYIDVKTALINDPKKGGIILRGPMTDFTAADTTVITTPDQILERDNRGRLVKIMGLKHTYATIGRDTYPSIFDNRTSDIKVYPFVQTIDQWNQYIADSVKWVNGGGVKPNVPAAPMPGNMAGPTYGFKNPNTNVSLFGSALMKFGDGTDLHNNLILRTSGYSKFANTLLPPDGQKINLNGLLVKFASKSGFVTYQLQVNSDKDVVPVE